MGRSLYEKHKKNNDALMSFCAFHYVLAILLYYNIILNKYLLLMR